MENTQVGQPIVGWRVDERGQKHVETLGKEGHVITIAPTGAGKGTCVLIPTLLRYPGQCIVIDAKGEAARLTAARRQAMGHAVHVLDPFGATGLQTSRLNPFDLVRDSEHPTRHAGMLLDVLVESGRGDTRDPFWEQSSKALLEALLIHLLDTLPVRCWTIAHFLRQFPRTESRTKALIGEMMQSSHALVRMQAAVLRSFMENHDTARDIVAHASTVIAPLAGNVTARSTEMTDIDLDALKDGKPMSIYLVIPPNRLSTAKPLLRTWLMTLSTALLARKSRPERSTLMLIDEAAQLGRMELMVQAMTLMRGFGLQCWSFWQDLSQLQGMYPESWQTLLANASAIQIFGLPTVDDYLQSSQSISIPGSQSVKIALAKRFGKTSTMHLTPYYLESSVHSPQG